MAMKKKDEEEKREDAQEQTALIETKDEEEKPDIADFNGKKAKKEKKKPGKQKVEIIEVTEKSEKLNEYSGGNSRRRISKIIIAVIVILILILAGVGAFMLYNMANTYTSSEYSMEQYTYNGVQYVGNKRFNKPDGLNLVHGTNSFALGEFKGTMLTGYGIVHDDLTTNLGVYKKYNPKGYQLHKNKDTYWIVKYKKDKPTGYAYKIDGDQHSIVKMKVKSDYVDPDYTPYETVIAVDENGVWITPKGKELKIKDNKYKDFEWVDLDTLYIDGATYKAGGAFAQYSNDDVKMTYEGGEATYDTTGNDSRDGLIIHLDNEGLSGQNVKSISNGSKVENFELKIKDMTNEDVD
ncbi:MAG: hypothetical protein K5985_02210 [Lachnospiraceae bacterium]|nr:hypothetical protein [Lachnospiraceae bacterium]